MLDVKLYSVINVIYYQLTLYGLLERIMSRFMPHPILFSWVKYVQTICLWKSRWNVSKWNEWSFKPRFCTCNTILGKGQPGVLRWILLWIMSLMQHRALDLLSSSPACHHCTTDVPVEMLLLSDIYHAASGFHFTQIYIHTVAISAHIYCTRGMIHYRSPAQYSLTSAESWPEPP